MVDQAQNWDVYNVVLLGETGAGKSTFINALANYFAFDTFEQTKNYEPIVLISSVFTEQVNGEYDARQFTARCTLDRERHADKEHHKFGESATQAPHSYVFPFPLKKMFLRIVDTPGIGDARGFDQDSRNMREIVRYLSFFEKIHAIIVLMKANEARLTPSVELCLDELLVHLPRGAQQNLFFGITNCAAHAFTPGESYRIAEAYLKQRGEQSGVEIPFSGESCYCFDNMAFRAHCVYLADQDLFEMIYGKGEDVERCFYESREQARKALKMILRLQPIPTSEISELKELRSALRALCVPRAALRQKKNNNANANVILYESIAEKRKAMRIWRVKLTVKQPWIVIKQIEDRGVQKRIDDLERQINDEIGQRNVNDKEDAEVEAELNVIRVTFLALAARIKSISIIYKNEGFSDIVDHAINEEKGLGKDSTTLEMLQKMKAEHEEEILLFTEAEKKKVAIRGPSEIAIAIDRVRALKHSGQLFKYERDTQRMDYDALDIDVPLTEKRAEVEADLHRRENFEKTKAEMKRPRVEEKSEQFEKNESQQPNETALILQQLEDQSQQIRTLQAQIEEMRLNEEQWRNEREESRRKQEAQDRRRREDEEAQWEEIRALQVELEQMRMEEQQRRDEKEKRRRQKQDEKRKRDEENQRRQQEKDRKRLEKEEARAMEIQALQAQIEQIRLDKAQQLKEKEDRRRLKEEERRQKERQKAEKRRREEENRLQKEEEEKRRRNDEERNKKIAQMQMAMEQMQEMMTESRYYPQRGPQYYDYQRHPMERGEYRQEHHHPRFRPGHSREREIPRRYRGEDRENPRNNFDEQRRNDYNDRRDFEERYDRQDQRIPRDTEDRQPGARIDRNQERHRYRKNSDENGRPASSRDMNQADIRVGNIAIPGDSGTVHSPSIDDDEEMLLPTTCPQ